MIILYREGNKNALDDLITQNQGIIHKLLKRFYYQIDDLEDLIQEANIGLIYAAKKYDPDNPNKALFITYACYWIIQKISRYLKKNNTDDQERLDKPIGAEGFSSIIDFLNSDDNVEDEVIERRYQLELKEALNQSMSQINSLKEREIISFNFGLNSTIPLNVSEIGAILNITPERVQQDKNRAIKKLRATAYKLPIQKYRNERNEEIQEKKYNNIDSLIYSTEKLVQYINNFNYGKNIGGFNYEKNARNNKSRTIIEGIQDIKSNI